MDWFSSRREAVSPIVSTLLLIVITVSAFSLVYYAADSWIRSQRRGPLLRLKERIVIEDVWFTSNSTGKYVCVYIRNIGKVSIGLFSSSLRVNDAVPSGVSFSSATLDIGKGGWVNASFAWTGGTTYKITIVTDRGGEFTTYETA